MDSPKIFIVGPLPEPVGGVSSHILRQISFFSSNYINTKVLDGYEGEKKHNVKGNQHLVFLGPLRFFKILWYLFKALNDSNDVCHLHFSSIIGRCFTFIPLLFIKKNRFYLTLHHGDQKGIFKSSNKLMQRLSANTLKKYDLIFSLSEQQTSFYKSIGISENNIFRLKSVFKNHLVPNFKLIPPYINNLKSIEEGGDVVILMSSGYPNKSYRFEESINFLNIVSMKKSCILIICLYGKSNDPVYEKKLRQVIVKNKNIFLVEPMQAEGFLALVSKANLYLRPSTIDSYGLAITDALDVGTPCLASDVCKRDERCQTFPTRDLDSFYKKGLEIIKEPKKYVKKLNYESLRQEKKNFLLKYN